MKKIFMWYIILNSILQLCIGCETRSGTGGVSENIEESKRRGVFVKEYMVSPNPYKINDTLQVTVKEVWLENEWFYGKNLNESHLYNNNAYQICINSIKSDLRGCAINWTIGINGDKYIRMASENSLIGDFKSLPPDTIEYKVQSGYNLSDSSIKVIIGKFVLIKKR